MPPCFIFYNLHIVLLSYSSSFSFCILSYFAFSFIFLLILSFPQVAPCVNNTKVDFSWTVTCTDLSAQQKVESSALFQATRYQATVRLDQRVLTGGVTCTFNVTGSMNYDPNVKSSVSQDIKAKPSPLELAIFGGKVVDVGYGSLWMKSLWFVGEKLSTICKSFTLLLSGFVLGSPEFNSSTALCK